MTCLLSSLKGVKSPVCTQGLESKQQVNALDSSRRRFWGHDNVSPRRRELCTSRSNNKRDIDCGNGTRRKRSVDVWIERSRKKNPWNNRTPALNVQSRARPIYPRESVYSSAERRFSSSWAKDSAARNSGRGAQFMRENAALFRGALGKTWHGNPIRCIANPRVVHANSRKTDERIRHYSFSLTTSFVYKRQERGLWNFITRTHDKIN